MRRICFAIMGLLLTGPALAQPSETVPAVANQNEPQDQGKVTTDTQQRLRQSLEQSGFKDIQITAESYLVRAKAPDGSRVIMTISPGEVAGVIESRRRRGRTPGNSSAQFD